MLITPYSLRGKDSDIEIECKIVWEDKYIDTEASFNYKKGATNWIMSFITWKYAENMKVSGMIWFIKKWVIEDKIDVIKDRIITHKYINTIENLKSHEVDKKFKYSYLSKHKRDWKLNNISIYHLFFDFT
jgi:hypothetical protein